MKRYYISVKTYLGTNRLETELNKYVKDKYDHAIINYESICDMQDDIKCKLDELQKKYPRCKTKKLIMKMSDGCPHVDYYKSDDSCDRGTVFVLSSYLIIREYTEGVGL